jgi:hypothetical protein
MAEQVVGWPLFTIEAPAGTTVELLVHEAHQPGGPPLLNTHFHAWTRFTCREGVNHFETFDFESLRWLHLHIHNYKGPVTIRNVGTRRRQFPWPQKPLIACNDARIQKVLAASVNTLHNCAQETIVDGMGRERQQYSGDGGHQIHAVYATFGETRLPARYISTFSQGMTPGGYFMDSWPAYDRLARVMERQLQLTGWGPILDHSVGFVFDCYHHYMQTGNLDEVREAFPRLLRFLDYLRSIQGKDGLLPVEHLGIPSVWIDHEAYQQQRHKQCAFNLYTAAMAGTALTTLCKAFSESQWEQVSREFSQSVHRACVNQFWSKRHEVFVNNLPWLDRESQMRTCDRSLATSVLYDFCPDGLIEPAIAMLADPPPHLGLSYPANAIWRMWALAKGRRMDVILKDLRERWYAMDSVQENNTLQENWKARRDTHELWSHCPLGPLIIFHQGIVGVQPLEAGFVRCRLTPQPADLTSASVTTHTVKGPIFFALKGAKGDRQITLRLPSGCLGELVLDERERVRLPALQSAAAKGMRTFLLEGGREKQLHLKYT